MFSLKPLGAAGAVIASALVGGTLIGSALAAPGDDLVIGGEVESEGGAYCDVFVDAFAAELGVDPASLMPAARAAALAAVDAAIAAGDLDDERGARIRERIAEAEGDFCAIVQGHHGRIWRHAAAHAHRHFLGGLADVAAESLGLERADLVGQLRDGATLGAIAAAQGVSYEELSAAITAAATARLDEAVGNERISRERADRVLERLAEWLAEQAA